VGDARTSTETRGPGEKFRDGGSVRRCAALCARTQPRVFFFSAAGTSQQTKHGPFQWPETEGERRGGEAGTGNYWCRGRIERAFNKAYPQLGLAGTKW